MKRILWQNGYMCTASSLVPRPGPPQLFKEKLALKILGSLGTQLYSKKIRGQRTTNRVDSNKYSIGSVGIGQSIMYYVIFIVILV